ncbi:MAG: zinc dependent phospholipase C family protein [Clostridia bacterium]|nr:zinc dependent phospholipase C family protein [Clostridia bacterium]
MPAIYAHLQFGEAVIKALPPAFFDMKEKYPDAFALGTQGPNLLSFHHPFQNSLVRSLSTRYHNASAEWFFLDAGKRMLKNAKEDILRDNGAYAAYVCGYLTHFVLDAVCHPYINAEQDEQVTHNKIETEFEKNRLRKAGKPTRGYNPADEIAVREETLHACAEALGIPSEDIALCAKTLRRSAWWFSHKSGFIHAVAHTVLFFTGTERRFGDMFYSKKDDQLCARTNEVLDEKFDIAIEKAKALIENYFSTLPQTVAKGKLDDFFRYNYSASRYEEGETE